MNNQCCVFKKEKSIFFQRNMQKLIRTYFIQSVIERKLSTNNNTQQKPKYIQRAISVTSPRNHVEAHKSQLLIQRSRGKTSSIRFVQSSKERVVLE